MTHDELAQSLADHLRGQHRMTWCNIQLGPSGSVRPDVYTIDKSYAAPNPMAYECKVSLADYQGDVTSGKWQTYLRFASGVYFASVAGLLTKDLIPDHCGLIILKDGRWRVARRPVLRPVTVPQEALIKLLIDGIGREGPRYRQRGFDNYRQIERLRQKFGDTVAKVLTDHQSVHHEIEYAKSQAERIVSDARLSAERIRKETAAETAPLRQELCEILDLPVDAINWQVRDAVRKLRENLKVHPSQAQLARLTQAVRFALERDGFKDVEA